MQHHVFLSYSRIDSKLMRQVRASLEEEGLTVWTDQGIKPGTSSWDGEIENALMNTQCVIVILTPSAFKAKGLRDEVNYAFNHHIQMFPLLAEGEITDSVPLSLQSVQWVDIREDYDEGINRLIETICDYLNIESRSRQIERLTREKNNQIGLLRTLKRLLGTNSSSPSDKSTQYSGHAANNQVAKKSGGFLDGLARRLESDSPLAKSSSSPFRTSSRLGNTADIREARKTRGSTPFGGLMNRLGSSPPPAGSSSRPFGASASSNNTSSKLGDKETDRSKTFGGLTARFGSGAKSYSSPFSHSTHSNEIEADWDEEEEDIDDENEFDGLDANDPSTSGLGGISGRFGRSTKPSLANPFGNNPYLIDPYDNFDDEASEELNLESSGGNPNDSPLSGITTGLSGISGRFGSGSSPSDTNRAASSIIRLRFLIIILVLIAIILAIVIFVAQQPLR